MLGATISGYITTPKLFDKGNNPFLRFMIGHETPVRGSEEYETRWITVLCYGKRGQRLAEKLKKGDYVVVTGQFYVDPPSEYTKGHGGFAELSIRCDQIGYCSRNNKPMKVSEGAQKVIAAAQSTEFDDPLDADVPF